MREIRQRNDNDCGVACVAMVAGVSYFEARQQMFPDGAPGLTEKADLIAALEVLGRKPTQRLQSFLGIHHSVINLPFDAILKCNYRKASGEWHWVVWDAKYQKIRDPKRPKYKRIRAHSYLRVE